MNSSSLPALTLYREANRVSRSLRTFCEQVRPRLPSMTEDELSDCVDRYTNALCLLDELHSRINRAEDTSLCPSGEQAECETLRSAIHADLDQAALTEDPLRSALQNKLEENRSLLIQIRKKSRLSAYLLTPMAGQRTSFFDKRD